MNAHELVSRIALIEPESGRGNEQFTPVELEALKASVEWIADFNLGRREAPQFDLPTLHKLSDFEGALHQDILNEDR